jgi:hypothetical protein
MITKYQMLKELKQRIAQGDFIDYVADRRNGIMYHQIRFGSGISISIADNSRNMYINFAFNRNEKEEVLELLKNTTPIVSEKTKQSFFKRLFSKSK